MKYACVEFSTIKQYAEKALEGAGKMNCDICKDDFPDDELVEADIMTCDDDGNICEGPQISCVLHVPHTHCCGGYRKSELNN